MTNYTSDSIETLRFPESIRRSPGMYIGGTDSYGIFVCLRELLDNAADEYLAGRNKAVAAIIDPDGSFWVQDAGGGIPQGKKEFKVNVNGKAVVSSMPTYQAVFGELHTSGKFHSDAYKVSVGCFTGDTKIKLLNGKTVSFDRLYQRWMGNQNPIPVMSFDTKEQKLVPSQISHVQLTKRTREIIKLEFDSGHTVKCTPDHKFYVRRGGSVVPVQAQYLKPSDSLVATYYHDYYYGKDDGYTSQSCGSKFEAIHRIVAEHSQTVPIGYHVHHINGNKQDNRPCNLESISPAEHAREHEQERAVHGRKKILETQADLRLENSFRFSDQNVDEDFKQEAWETKAVKIAVRALVKYGKVDTATFDAVRVASDMGINRALKYVGSIERLQQLAIHRHAILVKTQETSLRSLKELAGEDIAGKKSLQQRSRDLNWVKQVDSWKKVVLSSDDPMGITPQEFNRRAGAVVFGRFATLRRYTSLKRLKAHIFDGQELTLFADQSPEAQDYRMMHAEVRLRAPQVLRKVTNGFLNVCKKLKEVNDQTYSAAKSTSSPTWIWALTILKYVYKLADFDPQNFGKKEAEQLSEIIASHNHRIVRTTRLKLQNEVPVYDLTVDKHHVFFIEPGLLVANSHGVGVKSTNATADYFDVHTCYQGKWYQVGFKKGILTTPVQPCKAPTSPLTGKPMTKGTLVHFKPDSTIFSAKSFPTIMLQEWAEVMSYLSPGFKIVIKVKGKMKAYLSEEGPKDYIKARLVKLGAEAEPEVFESASELATTVVAFSNVDGFEIKGFTNGLGNSQGGKHVDSVSGALFKAVQAHKGAKQEFSALDFKDGLIGIVNAKLHKAQFSSQDKAKLTDDRMAKGFEEMVFKDAEKFFKSHKVLAKKLCDRACRINDLKNKFKASKAVAQALNGVKRNGLPPEYAPAHKSVPIKDRELILTEGASAAGGLRKVRTKNQALLPLTGKIMNAARAKGDKALLSKAIIHILGAVGYDPKQADPMSKLQVGKVICLADADSDGRHVNSLLLTLFAKYLPEMFTRGMIYVADMPEFYAINKDQLFTGDTLSDVHEKLKAAKVKTDVFHAKGWGEVDPQVLKILAVDKTRRLIQINPISLEDKVTFDRLMGGASDE